MFKRLIPACAAAVVLLALGWGLYQQRKETVALREELSRANAAKEAAVAKADEHLREIHHLEERVLQVAAAASPSPEGDRPFEDALDVWLGKIRKLNAYLDKHPHLSIPQMKLLAANDWLDATKNHGFASEADYRKALSHLRGLARRKVAPVIGRALREATAAAGGNTPHDPQDLAPYLPADFDRAIPQHLAINESGLISGLRDLKGQQRFVLVDKPVDTLWDTTLFYSTRGGVGVRQEHAREEGSVAAAISQLIESNGVPPTHPLQLMPFEGIDSVDRVKLDDLFTALTTAEE